MNDLSIRFLYGTVPGRGILKLLLNSGADRIIVRFLRSPWSRPLIPWYARRHNVKLDRFQLRDYRTFRDFFARKRSLTCIDYMPEHLISPCDGWLSAYPIDEDSRFSIKGTQYRLEDLLDDPLLARHYEGGTCMVFRLCASDYHRYCYIDDGYLWQNHYIPGVLHSEPALLVPDGYAELWARRPDRNRRAGGRRYRQSSGEHADLPGRREGTI